MILSGQSLVTSIHATVYNCASTPRRSFLWATLNAEQGLLALCNSLRHSRSMTTSPPYSVAQSEALGRHLVAARDIQPGQVVVAQDPYVAVLYDEQVPARCDYCFKTAQQGATLLRCSRSRHARYCSREHQAAAWQAGYKWECQALVAHAPRVPPPTIRLAARALWRKLRCGLTGLHFKKLSLLHKPLASIGDWIECSPQATPATASACVLVSSAMQQQRSLH